MFTSTHLLPVCRALGLPCRSVTNFVSAHDTNASLTVDKFFSGDGRELTSKGAYTYDVRTLKEWVQRVLKKPTAGAAVV